MISAFLTKIISMSLMSITAICATLLFKKILSHRLSPKAHLYIWIPIVLNLIIPHSFSSKLSVYNYVPDEKVIPVFFTFNSTMDTSLTTSIHTSSQLSVNPTFIIWITGLILSFVIPIISYYKFKKSLICSDISSASIDNEIKIRFSKIPRVMICKNEISPMILGIFRPIIIIPESVIKNFSDKQLSVVVLHEFVHLKRKDRYVNLLLMICTSLHWFNPLVRYMCKQIRHDLENVCDEITMRSLDKTHQKIYADTILDILEITTIRFINSMSSTMASTKKTLKSRIINICNFPKERLKLIALPCAIIISTTLLSGAVSKKAESAARKISENIEELSDEILPDYINTYTKTTDEDVNLSNEQNDNISDREFDTTTHDIITKNEISIFPADNNVYTDSDSVADLSENNTAVIQNTNTYTNNGITDETSDNQNDTAYPSNTDNVSNKIPTETPPEEPQLSDDIGDKKTKTYTYSSDEAIGRFSTDKYASGFASDNGHIKIDTVGLISSSDSNLSGYFNIYRDGELVGESVRASVSASPNSINFNQTVGSEHDYVFSVHTKTIDEQ